ncbi:MAG: YaiO family outer membrane beta-barrel protein [Candidatus Omnitrophota bacterium]
MSFRSRICIFLLAPGFWYSTVCAAGNTDIVIQKDICQEAPGIGLENVPETAKKLSWEYTVDYGQVDLPGREEIWKVFKTRTAYLYKGLECPYLEVNGYSRSGREDYTYNIGGYYSFGRSSANIEAGWGQDVSYVYKFKASAEYTHPGIGNLYIREGYKFLRGIDEDTHILSPGLIYYFGNHYVLLYYNAGFNNERGVSHWGQIKADFKLMEKLDVWLGAACGQRLYDISESREAHDQNGMVIFGGGKYELLKDLFLNLTLLYGEEEGDFFHRSIETGVSYTF